MHQRAQLTAELGTYTVCTFEIARRHEFQNVWNGKKKPFFRTRRRAL
jgi:hypothetical protein